MTALMLFNVLLFVVGPFVAVGLTAVPALLQWPVPVSAARRPVFTGPRVAGGGW